MARFLRSASLLFTILCAAGCAGNDGKTIEASGVIEATNISIGAENAGRVVAVRVDEGSTVRTGDTLVLLDDTELRIQVRQAQANLAAFESAYRLAREGSRQEDLAQAEAAHRSASADLKRMTDLLAAQSVTQKQYDDALARAVAAEQTYNKLHAGLRPEEVNGARARRDQAEAQLDLLRKKVRDCAILSPASGTVTLRGVEPGELVVFGMNVLRMTVLEKVKLTIYLSETDLGKVSLGQKAHITIDAFGSDRVFEGKIVTISPTAEFTPKNVQTKEERAKLVFGVKIEIPNPEGILKAGLPADAKIEIG